MLFDSPSDRIRACLRSEIARIHETCCSVSLQPPAELRAASDAYLVALRVRAVEAEFLDLETAERVGRACIALLDRLVAEPEDNAHHAVQAAVRYFVLEHDAEGDESITGFDDDVQVVEATAKVLGWSLPS